MSQLRIIYDTETYPNVHLFGGALPSNPKKYYIFEISHRRNDLPQLLQFFQALMKFDVRMVGFNNMGYDYPLLHFLLTHDLRQTPIDEILKMIYDLNVNIIDSLRSDDHEIKFKYSMWENDMWLKQMDLYKIHHFDNSAKATSLKMLEFNNRLDTIQELPFPPGTSLNYNEIDELRHYLGDDINATYDFFTKSDQEIGSRIELSAEFDLDFTNFNDTRIGSEMIRIELEKHLGEGCCYTWSGSKKVKKQTHREKIIIKDILFPYIKFKHAPMIAIHNFFYNWVLEKREGHDSITKEVFKDIPLDVLGDLPQYMNKSYTDTELRRKNVREALFDVDLSIYTRPTKPKELRELRDQLIPDIATNLDYKGMGAYSLRVITGKLEGDLSDPEHKLSGKIEKLNISHRGFQFDFGTGGIHGSVKNRSFYTTDTHIIADFDYEGYYPDMAEQNNMSPAQYPAEAWVAAQKVLGAKRKLYAKGTALNTSFKLGRNAAYGKSNDQHSFFFDPQYTMQTCINGQLLICVAAEEMMDLPEAEIIQVNTDGFTMYLRRDTLPAAIKIAKDWDAITGLHMEGASYKAMHVGDVNNYLAVDRKNNTKEKGRYATRRAPHQNQSALIVPKAAIAYLTKGIPVETFIRKHTDHYDFMLRTKLDRRSQLLGIAPNGVAKELQRITRYCVSTEGYELLKRMPTTDKERVKNPEKLMKDTGIEAGWLVQDCNTISNFNPALINYDYYIERANKLIQMEVDWEKVNDE